VFEWDWDDANVDHIAEHDISPEEVEEVFADRHSYAEPAASTPGERRWGLVGATDAGRVLLVIYTRRAGRVRVVTARDASPVMRRRCRRR
jgi:uncharacterized DUF497 family protein